LTPYQQAQSVHAHQVAKLQEANENLVLAALTAQELQAAAEQAQARQMEVLAVVAHELRTPLAPIRNAAMLLVRERRADEPLLHRVQGVIERQVAHMARLVGDLLDVSRAHVGKLRLERQVVDMALLIDDAVLCCRPAMDARLQHFGVFVRAGGRRGRRPPHPGSLQPARQRIQVHPGRRRDRPFGDGGRGRHRPDGL
jgi:signal transduction histidine kinase